MRTYRHAHMLIVAAAALAVTIGEADAQKMQGGGGQGRGAGATFARTPPRPMPPPTPQRPDNPRPRGPGFGHGHVHPGIIVAYPPRGGYVDEPPVVREGAARRTRTSRQRPQRNNSGAPPAGERRFVPDEVVIGVARNASPQSVAALLRRNRLTELERQPLQLSGTTMLRLRIPDRRTVGAVVRTLESDRLVASAQPNYLFRLQQQGDRSSGSASAGDSAGDYAADKLRLPLAHSLATGENVRVAVIDSGIDDSHPELAGAIAAHFNALDSAEKAEAHGTGVAGLIAGHGRAQGIAPAAHILAVRAFDNNQGTSFGIRKGFDWAVANGARVINMSFAGPADPGLARSLAAAHQKGIVLVAAAGNAGPKSPPLYPAADPNVIAVTATDAADKLYAASNRGPHVAIAAPGVDVVAPGIESSYQVASGTSFAAAKISGIVALMLQHKPTQAPAGVRATLTATAHDLGPKGVDDQFGAGLADAYAAVSAGEPVAARSRNQ